MLRVGVEVIPADVDEVGIAAGLEPIEAVQKVARAKALAVDGAGRPVLAADTLVIHDGEVLGKPLDRDDAAAMLTRQSGSVVQVVTAVAIRHPDDTLDDRIAVSTLRVAELDDDTIAEYVATGEADDKAGALAVQGEARAFVTILDGSRSNVVGLPLAETAELLRRAGIIVEDPPAGPL